MLVQYLRNRLLMKGRHLEKPALPLLKRTSREHYQNNRYSCLAERS